MLINYNTHPVLKYLKTGSLNELKTLSGDRPTEGITNLLPGLWKISYKSFSKKIQKISEPFFKVLIENREKMLSGDLIDNIESSSGTFILSELSFCYLVESKKNKSIGSTIFVFGKGALLAFQFINDEQVLSWRSKEYMTTVGNGWEHATEQLIIAYVNFLKYAPIEVKRIDAGKKVKDIHGKYMNQTDISIEIIDSTWFTTLVKSEGFKVRGHFRLQPYGPGLTEKRLIWISDFEKKGYTREAKRPLNTDEL